MQRILNAIFLLVSLTLIAAPSLARHASKPFKRRPPAQAKAWGKRTKWQDYTPRQRALLKAHKQTQEKPTYAPHPVHLTKRQKFLQALRTKLHALTPKAH